MRYVSGGLRSVGFLAFLALAMLAVQPALAQDVMRPTEVGGVSVDKSGADVQLAWDAVTTDAAGNPETIAHYNIYRGTAPDFVPDKIGGSNRIGSPPSPSFVDPGATGDPDDFYYLVSAVDTAGNESNTKSPLGMTPPVLSGSWTATTIELDWTDAEPSGDIVSYRVYYGKSSGEYEFVEDVGLANGHSLAGLQLEVNWFSAVTGVDTSGNETLLSNEHVDAVNGTVVLRAHDAEELCWGAADCTPTDPEKVQRSDGWQLMVPVDFPEGDWTSVSLEFTMDSRLCIPPHQGTTTKCGSGNPCVSPPCNGGYNPCGDPWDRTAQVFMVLDDCIAQGGSCITQNNLELLRAVTPFGSDARPPDGTGFVPPRVLTMDVTPFAPLFVDNKYVGVEIGHYVQKGHWVTVDFVFSERPDLASDKPPADGIEVIGFGGFAGVERQVTVPATATDVKMRLFTTGHGGGLFCDGGSRNAQPCTGPANCPGGVCNPCDEFCHRANSILVDSAIMWSETPWRTDCNLGNCSNWNACGFPSCTYPRAGWCPGYIACHHNAPCDNDLDFTSLVTPGATHDIDYNVRPVNGSWTVSLVMYWYE